jgi:serine protein kinase
MELVNVFKSAALKYGTERRVILLHGPVGSSKSTIARLLKRGLERYSRTDEGTLYSYGWKQEDGTVHWCPMHEEPLHLVPNADRGDVIGALNADHERDIDEHHWVDVEGDLCPLCRFMYQERLAKTDGD